MLFYAEITHFVAYDVTYKKLCRVSYIYDKNAWTWNEYDSEMNALVDKDAYDKDYERMQ